MPFMWDIVVGCNQRQAQGAPLADIINYIRNSAQASGVGVITELPDHLMPDGTRQLILNFHDGRCIAFDGSAWGQVNYAP